MSQPRLLVPLVLVCVSLLVARAEAAKAPRCPDGSYVVLGQRLVTGDPAGAPVDLVTIAGRTVGIDSGCPPKRGLVKGTKTGTKIRVKWRRCGALRGVLLKALIDTACQNVSGTIKSKGAATASFDGVETSFATTTTTATTTSAPGSTVTTTTQSGGTTSTTLRSCSTDADLPALTAVMANGGTLDLPCAGGSVTIPDTLVVDGVNVTVRTPQTEFGRAAMVIQRDNGGVASLFRLFEVRGGSTLTLEGVFLAGGRVLGTSGAAGIHGTDGNGGAGGSNQDNNPGIPGGPGGKGDDAVEATAGENGGVGRGGAMRIEGGSTVVLRDCRIENNGAIGGLGTPGGAGGRGGGGGAGGRGGGGGGVVGGDGGLGGEAGLATEGRDGGDGGDAQGGGIWNAGSLTLERCVVAQNFAAAGLSGRGAAGGTGGGGGSGERGGTSFNNAPSEPSNQKAGGKGGAGRTGTAGKRGGNGGNGGNAFGGGIYNEGTLVVIDTDFRNNSASGSNGSYGASAGAGGGGGGGGRGGDGKPAGMGGNGADGGDGADGGSNGDGGGGIGGGLYSTNQPTLTNVTFRRTNGVPTNTVASGSGGLNNCTPGDFTCFGAGGPGGLGGTAGPGGSGPSGAAPNGSPGNDGGSGANGEPGKPGLSGDPECHAAGGSCN